MLKTGDRNYVLILCYGHLDKLVYSPPHPGRGLKVSSDYCPSIEGWVAVRRVGGWAGGWQVNSDLE